jgi:hypothetical protein
VMWVGNVPSDATTDELYTFFGRDIGAGGGVDGELVRHFLLVFAILQF